MHKNPRFNIVQEAKVNSPLFVVIEGQRTDAGSMAIGAKVLTVPMSRDDAIKAADKLESDIPAGHYTYTVVCFGAEIGFGEGETFEYAKEEAELQAADSSDMYPKEEWGYITQAPNGMQVSYNV